MGGGRRGDGFWLVLVGFDWSGLGLGGRRQRKKDRIRASHRKARATGAPPPPAQGCELCLASPLFTLPRYANPCSADDALGARAAVKKMQEGGRLSEWSCCSASGGAAATPKAVAAAFAAGSLPPSPLLHMRPRSLALPTLPSFPPLPHLLLFRRYAHNKRATTTVRAIRHTGRSSLCGGPGAARVGRLSARARRAPPS
jgi:hypothetical protein